MNAFWEQLGLECRAGAGEDVEGTGRLSGAGGSPKQGGSSPWSLTQPEQREG